MNAAVACYSSRVGDVVGSRCSPDGTTATRRLVWRKAPLRWRHSDALRQPARRLAAKQQDGDDIQQPTKKVQTLSQRLGGLDDSYIAWADLLPVLQKLKIPSITPEQAQAALQEQEAVLVDIREEEVFDGLHAEGSVNVPMFVPAEGTSQYDKTRGLFYKLIPALGGMGVTDRNPEFAAQVAEAAGEDSYILVMCGRGGSISPWPIPGGIESRSWVAIYDLVQAGIEPGRLLHVRGGFTAWEAAGLECEYYEE
mmetsp:Transcript_33557/g.85734  ORF Transcript_33557/g.85734 Transcript_33557/m.85734 type:complete len:253 (+) Transcript_33557:133-891(+)